MMGMEETRLPGCAEELMRDLADTVVRDRNHPCVIIWSLANEEPIMTTEVGARIFKKLHRLVRRLDPTRPTTCAVVGDWFEAARLFEEHGFRLDVFGMNYGHNDGGARYDRFHEEYPDWPCLATESWGGFTSRGLYENNGVPIAGYWRDHPRAWESEEYRGFVSAYGTTFAGYGYPLEEVWRQCVRRPALSGTFIWTGFDYRGETAPHTWPAVISYFGMLDYCGFYKELAHYLRCWWRPEAPHTFLMPHWNWHGKEGENIRVCCYANAAEVELRLNGRTIGRETMPENGRLEWQVSYEPGRLEAIGRDGKGREVSRAERVTAGAPAKLALTSDAVGSVAVISAQVQDGDGNECPLAANLVEFEVPESAEILGVGNGNPLSHEPDKFTNKRKAHFGRCQITIRKTSEGGKVIAKAAGLQSGSVVV
jgi:beta-galactosidase